MRKAPYILAILAALVAGYALEHLRAQSRPEKAQEVLYYEDPMHPAYRSPKPGIAPDCGMQLVPVYAQDVQRSLQTSHALKAGAAHADPATRQMFGIQVAKAERSFGHGTLRAFGRVAADESRIYRVNLGTDGFVKETHNDAVGNHVAKNQHLALVYSPEFLSVAGGYLSANERAPNSMPKDNSAPSQNAASALARADRLRNLGMSDTQISELSTTRKIPEDIYLVSPIDGIILSRTISPGLRFEKHAEFYRIADLSHVWVLAEVFGQDAQAFRPGAIARITLLDSGQIFQARVSNVLPEIDPVTRTLKVRLELANPGFRLRPDMFVNVDLALSVPPGLTVPVEAVIDSGLSKRVFVETSEGNFEPREVQTGWTFGSRIEIVRGLREGETVVSAGTFLIDSESRMQLAKAAAGAAKADSGFASTALERNE